MSSLTGDREIRFSFWEKSISGTVSAIIIALLLWVGNTNYQSSLKIVSLQSDIIHINRQLDQAISSNYSAGDAQADRRNYDQRFNDISRRLDRLE